jgi:hypothetical protein
MVLTQGLPTPPLMAYMLCFKTIPTSLDPMTGMYVVREDMNIDSNRQCGAIIAASKLV